MYARCSNPILDRSLRYITVLYRFTRYISSRDTSILRCISPRYIRYSCPHMLTEQDIDTSFPIHHLGRYTPIHYTAIHRDTADPMYRHTSGRRCFRPYILELLRGPGCACGVERWGSESLYTSYVTIPGLRYRGAGRRQPSGTLGRSRRSWSHRM